MARVRETQTSRFQGELKGGDARWPLATRILQGRLERFLLRTFTIRTTSEQNHIDNGIPTSHDDYSSSVAQMQTQTDPGEDGSESQATSQAGEWERIRFALAEVKGTTYWYETPDAGVDFLMWEVFR